MQQVYRETPIRNAISINLQSTFIETSFLSSCLTLHSLMTSTFLTGQILLQYSMTLRQQLEYDLPFSNSIHSLFLLQNCQLRPF